ncbi:class I adenylate-forming enzyme family protein [Bordetella bronchiseptica]|uniref:Ligase n=3 Tax=Bordetella bronchiseptica TaxID=518 RepID=A0A0H3LHG3_BORBR|nr:AMP-binding protein [Bordetella bronchiseptica]KAK60578.1 AMP-binding enzyme [Bordetella bronchiseptica 980-2]SHQ27260.1 acyl-CoA synthetase (AMP-forming)/AMP-acid ligase II [Mycobacteroides abscessus subsp. abscessus]AMG87094.1 o-succinylbenzoate--CoA ligase [Bordetella bronchiseptica]AWP73436.1 o-succinylbenzoate--CoA ligase [Bordetella bronchiseptica]AWP78258.1 o-succinylbenzoate--CoA ligase [Bordetella bronchiseptica]
MQLIDTFDRGAGYGLAEPCFIEPGGRTLSYGQVQDMSHRIANGLRAAGLDRDSKVGTLSANHLLTFPATLGIVRSGYMWLPVNARNAAEENANILARGGCEFLFIHSQFAAQLPGLLQALPGLKGVVCIDGALPQAPSLQDWMARQSAAPARSDARIDDVVAIRGTGGTTGLPKGVLVTHRNYLALLANWYAAMPVLERPVHLVVAPLSHAAGSATFAACAYGGCNVILPTADPAAIIDAIGRYKVTQLFLPPTAIYKLLAHPEIRRGDYASLRYFLYSAAPMSVDKLREALDIFGPVMVQAYGQAEAPFMCTVLSAGEHAGILRDPALRHRLASCGRASPFVRLGIMDPHGNLLPAGERGEIVVQGDLVAQGYYQDPAKTAETFKQGWLHTGDVGYQDGDGYLYIVDRMKDLIVSGGFNISPSEVEQVLWAHPAVGDCAVVGVPDDHWGEAIKAVVELKAGAQWDAEQVLAYCRERLGSMKTPKTIEVWEQLPRSSVGKVLKRDIRERYWSGQARRV